MTADTDAERIAELDQDNRRLRRLLDQQNAPGELRHRLRSTLFLLRAIIQRSARNERDLLGYVAQLQDRLDAIARAQAFADQHGEVDLQILLADELFQYGASEGEKLLLSGPDVRLQPKAGQIVALAIHELAVNAVEHGVLGAAGGRIEVSWSLATDELEPALRLSWTEHGPALGAKPGSGGFGTEVLTRMLPYQLKADINLVVEPGGLRCTIILPLTKQVGRVVSG